MIKIQWIYSNERIEYKMNLSTRMIIGQYKTIYLTKYNVKMFIDSRAELGLEVKWTCAKCYGFSLLAFFDPTTRKDNN